LYQSPGWAPLFHFVNNKINETQNSLILGDSAVIFHVEGTRSFKPFADKDDVVVAAMLPVNPGARDRGNKRIA
jgi:hypothetical protein